jgi:hypothetical protein
LNEVIVIGALGRIRPDGTFAASAAILLVAPKPSCKKITSTDEVHMACSGIHRTFWSVAVAMCAAVALSPAQVSAQIVDEAKPVAAAAPPEAAQPATPAATAMATPAAAAPQGKPYYIEFRARNAQSYGHTFSMYGRLGGSGQTLTKTVSGLHPATESPVPWMIGHLILVPSETGASDGDKEDQYVIARFRMDLSADEYKKVVGYIKSLEAKSPVWHAVLYNCNAYVGDIAKFMGMEVPSSTMLMPAAYINELRQLNINKKGLIGTPRNVASADQLRAEALRSLGRRGNRGAPASAEAKPAAAETAPQATERPKPARGAAAKPQDTNKPAQTSSRQVEPANLSPN